MEQGYKGDTGDRGPRDQGLAVKGVIPDQSGLPTTGNMVGDIWMASDDKHVWFWSGTQWVDMGPLLQGPQQQRPTKTDIVDAIIGEATKFQFTGDKRDGAPPPITLQNFLSETFRYGAKALRARLSRLTLAELLVELVASAGYLVAVQEHVKSWQAQYERDERDADERARSKTQSERAKKRRRQPAIDTAASHYRDQKMKAKEAWDAIKENPFKTNDGSVVEILGSELARLKQRMCVTLPDGRRLKRSIGFDQWRQAYWPAAAKPG